MYASLVHYVAVNEPVNLFISVPVKLSKSNPFQEMMRLAKATHIFGGEPKKPATVITPDSQAKPPASIASAAGHVAKPAAQIVSPGRALVSPAGKPVSATKEMPSGFRGKVTPPESKIVQPKGTPSSKRSVSEHQVGKIPHVVKRPYSESTTSTASKPAGGLVSAAGQAISSKKPESPEPFRGRVDLGAKPASTLATSDVSKPSSGVVDTSGKRMSTSKPVPSGFRGTVSERHVAAAAPKKVSAGVSAVSDSNDPNRKTKMLAAGERLSSKQRDLVAASGKPTSASKPLAEKEMAWKPSDKATPPVKKEKASILPEGERKWSAGEEGKGEKDSGGKKEPGGKEKKDVTTTEKKKPSRGVNVLGAYHLGYYSAPGGPGSGTRAAAVLGGRAAMGAHRLLNARASSRTRREQYGRESALSVDPSGPNINIKRQNY